MSGLINGKIAVLGPISGETTILARVPEKRLLKEVIKLGDHTEITIVKWIKNHKQRE